jgi:hypothetical protein
MSLFPWLQNRTSGRPPGGRAQHRPAAPRFHPRLEALEDRTLPSTYYAATASQLIADIGAANKAGGSNTVVLTAPTTSPYVLTTVNNTADKNGANGLPQINKKDALTIVGNGDTIERSTASPAFRLFNVAGGGSLTLENLTLQNGWDTGVGGGAIYNQGTLVLSQVTVQGNTAYGLPGAGGGIWSNGSLTVENSTIAGNLANLDWNEPAFGGGIYIAGGTANITGSTFASNAAEGSAAYGGAVYVAAGTVTLSGDSLGMQSATGGVGVPGNSAEGWGSLPGDNGYGGALYVAGGSVTLTNDYVQGNTAFDNQGTGYVGPNGGGIFKASGATVYLDSFTVNNTTNNSPNDIRGGYTLLS